MENNQQSQQPNMQQQMDQMLQQQGQGQPVQPMQPMNGPAKVKKKKNIPAIVLGVVAVLGIGAGAYFGVQYFGEKDRADKLAKQNATVTTAEPEEATSETTAEATSSGVSYGFDESKIKNGEARYILEDSATGINVQLRDETLETDDIMGKTNGQKEVKLYLTGSELKEIYPESKLAATNTVQTKTITFDKKVKDLAIAGFGQAPGDEVVLFVMEDGSVEYIPVTAMLKDGKYASYGKISDLSNVVRIFKNVGATVGGSWNTNLVQDTSGNIYDLRPILKKINVIS